MSLQQSKPKQVLSDIQFDQPVYLNIEHTNFSTILKQQTTNLINHYHTQSSNPSTSQQLSNNNENPLNQTYSKNQFTMIIRQLSQQDPLYTCDKQNLQFIYDKTIQHNGGLFTGNDLAQFANALKQKNKQKFINQIYLYRQYINKTKTNNKLLTTIKSKQLLNYIYQRDQIGYLTDSVYQLLNKQQQVSIKKLQSLLVEIQNNFNTNQQLSIPKKISLKKSAYQYQNQQQGFQQLLFEVVQKQRIDIQGLRNIKDQILQYIQDPSVSIRVQKQLNRLQDNIIQINQCTIPSLKQQLLSLTKYNKQIIQQLSCLYQQLDKKNNQLVDNKNIILQLTEQNNLINKQLINNKILCNQKQLSIQELQNVKYQLEIKLNKQQQEMKLFLNQYHNIKQDYQLFITKLNQQQQKKKLEQQTNLFPTLSIKQKLEDAQTKIKLLKQQKSKLLTELETNQNIYQAKINHLQRQLQQAKKNSDKAQQLKMTGMSRLSKNFQAIKQSTFKRSMLFQSVVSVLGHTNKPINTQNTNKMSGYYEQAQQFMRQSKSIKRVNNIKNQNKQQNNQMKRTKQLIEQIQNTFDFQDKLQNSFYRQSKADQLKYNFCDIHYNQAKKKWQQQNPTILGQQNNSYQIKTQQQQLNNNDCILKQSINNIKKQQKQFLSPVQIISKSGNKHKKIILINRKGIFLFDTKLRFENDKDMKFTRLLKITFTYYNLDCFVISFKRKQSPMKKRIINTESDIVFKCLKTKQLLSFLSQPIFKQKILKQAKVKIGIQKQQNLWIRQSTQKDIVLSNCGNFYNPFRLNLTLKNHHNNMFYAQLSRQNFFSRSYIIICIVEEFGVYCFQWYQDQMENEKRFIYLLPLVKRMLFVREVQSKHVKLVYQDWNEGKTFLLRFKNPRESLKFQTVCKQKLKSTLNTLQSRKKMIEDTFSNQNYLLNNSVENSFQNVISQSS